MPTVYRRHTVSSFNGFVSAVAGAVSDSGYYSLVDHHTIGLYVRYYYALPHVNGNEYLELEFYNNNSNYILSLCSHYFYNSSGNNCVRAVYEVFSADNGNVCIFIVTSKAIFIQVSNYYGLLVPINYPYNIIHTITQPVTSGANKTIYLDSVSDIPQNSKWIISTESTAGRCLTKVTSVGSNYVVVDHVGMNVPAGSKFMKFRSAYIFFSDSSLSTLSFPDYSTSSSSLLPCYPWSSALSLDSSYSNNYFIDFVTGFPLLLKVSGNNTSLSNFITLDDNTIYLIPLDSNLTIPTDNVIHHDIVSQGTVSSATSNTLTDSSKNWATNSLAGKYVLLQSTKDCKKIVSNTSTTITVFSDFFSTPSNGSNYIICEKPFYISNLNTIKNVQVGYLTFPLFDL